MAQENESSHPLQSSGVGDDPSGQKSGRALRQTILDYISCKLQARLSVTPAQWQQHIPFVAQNLEYLLCKNARTKEEYADQETLNGRIYTASKGVWFRLHDGMPIMTPRCELPNMIPTPEMTQYKQQEKQRQQLNEQFRSSSGSGASRIHASSSSNPYLSPTWDLQKMHLLEGLQGRSEFQIFPTSHAASRFDGHLSSLHSNLFGKVISGIPTEKLFELSSVCKNWEALMLHGHDHYILPSTRNGPIAVVVESSGVSIKTYDGKLKLWHDQDMGYFLMEDSYFKRSSGEFSASGGLLYRYRRDPQYDRVVDICNPITKKYRRLEVPLRDPVHEGLYGKYGKATVLGVIVEKQPDWYKVIVQREVIVLNGDGSDSTINSMLVYNSASCLWENGGTMSPRIVERVGQGAYCSTSSGGDLYFLTTDSHAPSFDWRKPRLLKYDPQNRRCSEISPLPEFVGRWAGPTIVEHRGEVMYITRQAKDRGRYQRPCYPWVFYRLQRQNVQTSAWPRTKEMPEDVADTLAKRVVTVRCEGNGDMVYFYGKEKLGTSICIVAHDLVADSWVWLADISPKAGDKSFKRLDLLSIEPSFIMV